MFIFLKSY